MIYKKQKCSHYPIRGSVNIFSLHISMRKDGSEMLKNLTKTMAQERTDLASAGKQILAEFSCNACLMGAGDKALNEKG